MTAQVPDYITYKNKEYALFENPLLPFLIENSIQFSSTSTANYRGYIANWEIRESDEGRKLFLTRLQANLPPKEKFSLDDLFANCEDGVFADWYSGSLKCPFGRQLEYVHAGYASVYEFELLFEIEKGLVIHQETKINNLDKINQKYLTTSDTSFEHNQSLLNKIKRFLIGK